MESTKTEPADDRLIVVIEGYMVDITDFVEEHPGSKESIMKKRAKGIDITPNFIDHFGYTVQNFRN